MQIQGIIPLGTSLDYESERTRKHGCWDGPSLLAPTIKAWTTDEKTQDFEPNEDYCNFLIDIGFGKNCDKEARDFWVKTIKSNYHGDDGRRRARMAAINLSERDGLHSRLSDVRCPVLWLHVSTQQLLSHAKCRSSWRVAHTHTVSLTTTVQGTDDAVYTVPNAEEEIKLFVNSPDARLVTVEGGQHFLSFSHPKEVDQNLIDFVGKYSK